MSKDILNNFSKEVPLEITPFMVKTIQLLMYSYESRQKHPQALNSPLLGVYPMFFTTQDQKNLFDVCGTSMEAVKKLTRKCPAINQKFKVTSDPYNLLSMWVIHSAIISSNITDTEKYNLSMVVAKMLHYKFFTSFVGHSYPHGADEATMKAVVNSLTKKFDIIEYGTWKATIEARCDDFLDNRSIHYNTLTRFDDDHRILYMLSDTQTRMRNKVKNINEIYYDFKKKGDAIASSSLNTNIDGEKIMRDIVTTSDSMSTNISGEILNINQWIENRYVKFICDVFPNITPVLFRQLLVSFSNLASIQSRKGLLDKVVKTDGRTQYVGSRVLVRAVLEKTYEACKRARVNPKSKNDILIKARNAYSASRISDNDIIDVKESVNTVIVKCVNVNREATIASLRVAFIYYIMLKSFEYL